MPLKGCAIFVTMLAITAGAAAAQTTIHVVPVAGSPAASGTALLNALAAITDNSGAKTYVLKLDPGIYDLGSTELVMKPFVDIEGSGQGSTIVRGAGNGDTSYLTGIIKAAGPAELRNLQVASLGGGLASSIGVYVPTGASVNLRDITVVAGGASENWGVRSVGASPVLRNVTIDVSGGSYECTGIGLTGAGSSPTLKHAVIDVSCPATFDQGIYSDGATAPRELRDLQIDVTGTGATNSAYGIYVGAFAGSNQTFVLTDSNVVVSGAAANDALLFYENSGSVFNAKGSYLAASGTQSYGVRGQAASSLSLDRCDVAGDTGSVMASTLTADIGDTQLAGIVFGGTYVCTGAFKANYSALNSVCQ
jgi:hypothetical protein